MVHPIKTVYNFVVSIQVICLIIFLFYLFESNLDLTFPIVIDLELTNDIKFYYKFDFHFNIAAILIIIGIVFTVFILSSVNIVGSGVTDSGNQTIKQFISFLVKYSLLNLPVLFLLSRSSVLNSYSAIISLVILVIYFLNLLIDSGSEQNV